MSKDEKKDLEKNLPSPLSKKDILILKKLLEDGRLSSSKISKEINLGKEIINYRIKRLIKKNFIIKFVPKINDKLYKYREYDILIKLNIEDELSKEKFIKEKIGNKYLSWIIKSESGWDLIVRLYAESLDEFKLKLDEILEKFSNFISDYYTIIASDELKETEQKIILKKLFNEDFFSENDYINIKKTEFINLDEKDKSIIKLLETDARLQYKEIGEKLNIPSDTVKYRIERMKEKGVIQNFIPIINFKKIGFYYFSAILRLKFIKEDEKKKLYDYFYKNNFISKVIKSLNSEEYFLNLLFEDKDGINHFKEEINSLFPNKIELLEIFEFE